MRWIKKTIIDIIISLLIVGMLIVDTPALNYFILIYTPVMLLLKILTYKHSIKPLIVRKKSITAPDWFYHLLYGINIFVLLICNWWITSIQWILIWGISWYTKRNNQLPSRTTCR